MVGARGHVQHKLHFAPSVCTCSRRFSENLLLWALCSCDGAFGVILASQPWFFFNRDTSVAVLSSELQVWSGLVNFGDGLGFAVISNMATFSVLCKAPIALSSRQAGRALLRNAPVSRPVTLVALPRSRKSAAESSIARGRLVSRFRGEGLKRISPQLNGRKPWLQKSARTMHGVAVAFTGNDSSLANDIPSIDTLKASQLKKVDNFSLL